MSDKPYKDQVICRGSYAFGSACGRCQKCKDEQAQIAVKVAETKVLCPPLHQEIKSLKAHGTQVDLDGLHKILLADRDEARTQLTAAQAELAEAKRLEAVLRLEIARVKPREMAKQLAVAERELAEARKERDRLDTAMRKAYADGLRAGREGMTNAAETLHIADTLAQLSAQDAEIARLRGALEGFSRYCIKPECKCWACEALSAQDAPSGRVAKLEKVAEAARAFADKYTPTWDEAACEPEEWAIHKALADLDAGQGET